MDILAGKVSIMMCRQMTTFCLGWLLSCGVLFAQTESQEETKTTAPEHDEWQEQKEKPVNSIWKSLPPGGAYGAVLVSSGKIGNAAGTMLGARGALMLTRSWGVGIGGKGLNSQYDHKLPADYSLVYRYAGLTIEHTWHPENTFHINTVLLAGEGRLALHDEYADKDRGRDFFPIVELEVNGEINITPYARFLIGVSQRWVEDIELSGFSARDFMRPQAQVGFKLGLL